MLTSRGWWFLLIDFFLLVMGALASHPTLTVLGWSLLLWFVVEWLLFMLRIHFALRRVTVVREVRDERGPVDTLWAGRHFQVEVQFLLRGLLGLPHVAVSDRLPFGLEHAGGEIHGDGPLGAGRVLKLSYRVHCPAVGRALFEGVRLQTADLQGFFYHAAFVPGRTVYRILPVLVDAEGQPATTKRHNLLPPPGIHRLHRPGSGNELLDLRDYLPGDPPRTIAWKVSARRDRLITKEFESEVPVRCTLFMDTSQSVRVGPRGQNALTRLVEVAAAVAQANSANRDLTGLCLFDEEGSHTLRPARTRQHVAHLLRVLVDAASLAPSTGRAP